MLVSAIQQCLYIYLVVLGLSCSMQDLSLWHVGSSSLTRARTWGPPALGVQSLSQWTTREVPSNAFYHIL